MRDEFRSILLFSKLFFGIAVLSLMLLAPVPGLAGDTSGETDMKKTDQQSQPMSSGVHHDHPGGKHFGPHNPIINQSGNIMVYIRMSNISNERLNELMEAGAVITHIAEEYQTVTAFISPDRLNDIKRLPSVMNVREAEKPLTN